MGKQFTLIILFFIFFISNLSARHLLGGYLSYECLGDGDYEVTMRLYRDCNCTNCANFDEPAIIAIYNCNWEACGDLTQANPIAILNIPLASITPIDLSEEDCAEAANICIEQGVYQFKLSDFGFRLPPSDQDYYIVYQRCCRAESVTNILDPTNTGMTLYAQISPMAYEKCNNSVSVDVPPMFSACVQEALDYPLILRDEDGDSLAIGFCAPLNGGGSLLTPPEYTSCLGAQPNPPCPPPYSPVTFVNGFDPGTPINLELDITIDSNIAKIIGTMEELGKYSIGLCIQEFNEDGLLVNTTPLEFETLVAIPMATSTEDLLVESNFNIYPNPNQTGELYVELKKWDGPVQLEIFSAAGQLAKRLEIQQVTTKVDIEGLESGLYLAKISSGNQSFTQKLIVQ